MNILKSQKKVKNVNSKKDKSGFTMNELMIAATVIGLVAAITVPTLNADFREKRWSMGSEKLQRSIKNAIKTMRVEDKLTGFEDTQEFIGVFKDYLGINKICPPDKLDRCFAEGFLIYDELKKLSNFQKADSFNKDWDSNIYGAILNDGTHVLLAYNKNCSKYETGDCLAVFYDTDGKNKTNKYTGTNGQSDMGTFNIYFPNSSGCGSSPAMTDIYHEKFFSLHMDGPAGSSQGCIDLHKETLTTYCENSIVDGYNGVAMIVDANYNYLTKIPIGTFVCHYPCIARGTLISLSDGSHKAIEDISYDDDLLVWDFDNGRMSSAKPAWIKQAEVADSYNLLTFSDGTQLKTINQHRIFNKDLGKFTYPMTDETPLGTTTLLADGREVQLVDKKVVYEPVEFYNLITANHFNCFASNVLTSNRFNNLYPIVDYKFVKDNRELTPYSEYENFVSRDWYEKLRLAEQTCDEDMKLYLSNLVRYSKKDLALV